MARVGKTKPKVKAVTPIIIVVPEPIISAFAVGDHVTHSMFGDGTVDATSGTTLTIAFEKFGTKQVLDGFVKRRP